MKVYIIGHDDIGKIDYLTKKISDKEGCDVELLTQEQAIERGIDIAKTESIYLFEYLKTETLSYVEQPKHGLDKWERKNQQKYFNRKHSR